jgi:hypothetical protein
MEEPADLAARELLRVDVQVGRAGRQARAERRRRKPRIPLGQPQKPSDDPNRVPCQEAARLAAAKTASG